MSQSSEIQQIDDRDEDGFGVEDLLRVLRRHWRVILGTAVTVAALTAQIMLLIPNIYVATANVQVEQRRKEIVELESVVQQMGADTPSVESEVEVLRSADLALMVVDRLNLRQDPEFSGPDWMGKLWQSAGLTTPRKPRPIDMTSLVQEARDRQTRIELNAADTVRDYLRQASSALKDPVPDHVLQAFRDRLKASRVRNSLLISVTFTSVDPMKAAKIANAIVDLYLEAQINAKESGEQLARRLLDRRAKDLREKLGIAERRVETFKSANDLFDADGRSVLNKQLARELEEMVRASDKTAETRARFEEAQQLLVEGGDSTAMADVLESPTVRILRDELVRSLRKQAQLRTKYGPRHPTMVQADADVGKARSELVAQINSIITNLKTEMQVAASRENQLKHNLEVLKSRIASTADKTWQLDELSRDVESSRKLYETLLSRSKQMSQTAGLQFPDSRVVQRATVPLAAEGPKRKQAVLLALLGGFALAFGSAFLFETLRPGFETAGETEKELALAQVGSLPEIRAIGANDPMRNARYIIAEPDSLYAEAIRSLAHFIQGGVRVPQVVLVSSSLSGEGRTMTASNLAVQFAMTGNRTLLIDGDLRAGGLSQTLGLTSPPGLREVITGQVRPSKAILHDATTGLHVLASPRGAQMTASPVELLSSGAMAGLIDVLRGQFDIILIDAPPLLPVADSRILADLCDSAILLVRWRQTARTHVKQALRVLGANQAKVRGIVMSGVAEAEYAAAHGIDLAQTPSISPASWHAPNLHGSTLMGGQAPMRA